MLNVRKEIIMKSKWKSIYIAYSKVSLAQRSNNYAIMQLILAKYKCRTQQHNIYKQNRKARYLLRKEKGCYNWFLKVDRVSSSLSDRVTSYTTLTYQFSAPNKKLINIKLQLHSFHIIIIIMKSKFLSNIKVTFLQYLNFQLTSIYSIFNTVFNQQHYLAYFYIISVVYIYHKYCIKNLNIFQKGNIIVVVFKLSVNAINYIINIQYFKLKYTKPHNTINIFSISRCYFNCFLRVFQHKQLFVISLKLFQS
ncbi:hypothetical protein ABPG74_000026 [Tetrahymena malaccensis]